MYPQQHPRSQGCLRCGDAPAIEIQIWPQNGSFQFIYSAQVIIIRFEILYPQFFSYTKKN